MEKRIYGLENEYGFICYRIDPITKKKTPYTTEALTEFFKCVANGAIGQDFFLENGSRLYQDTGAHPEYATPECDSPLQVVLYDKAGEYLIDIVSKKVAESLSKIVENDQIKVYVFKHNTDSSGTTFGCHENYLLDRKADFPKLISFLIPYLITRQIYTGSGKIRIKGNVAKYFISQRSQFISEMVSISTTNQRGIINTRDEPHSDKERYRRLHVILGDSNISEYATYLKVGILGLILRMVEDDFIDDSFIAKVSIKEPVSAVEVISMDLSCSNCIGLDNGATASALDIQYLYLDKIQEYALSFGITKDEIGIIELWGQTLDLLKCKLMFLSDRIDWIIKKKLFDDYIDRRNGTWDSLINKLMAIDIEYHNIDRSVGFYYKLKNQSKIFSILKEEDINRAIYNPPKTRAFFRGNFIKFSRKKNLSFGTNWSYINVYSPFNRLYYCRDPFSLKYEEGKSREESPSEIVESGNLGTPSSVYNNIVI